MKKFLLIILILQLGHSAKAQYTPMLKEGSEWYQWEYFESSYYRHYKIKGDSTINNVTYKVVAEETYSVFNILLREDSAAKKIYRYNGAYDLVYYDFSLEPGQSFIYLGDTFRLDSISNKLYFKTKPFLDTVIEKMQNLRVFYFESGSIVWIEGIGSLSGVDKNVSDWNYDIIGKFLVCHYNNFGIKDFEYLFTNNKVECNGPVFLDELKPNKAIEPFPNPTTNGFFSIPLNDIQRIQVYNLYCTLLKVIPVGNGNQSFNISELPNGIYVLRMFVGKNAVVTQRIIKI